MSSRRVSNFWGQKLRMADEALVIVSCSEQDAELIASALVAEHLAACVSIVPGLLSVYRWQGKVQKDKENLLLIKTSKNKWQLLEMRIKELHSYEIPELILLPIERGYGPYLDWLNLELVGGSAFNCNDTAKSNKVNEEKSATIGNL